MLNKRIRELSIPWDLLFVLIIRNGERIIPNGKTVLREDDIVVVSALLSREAEQFNLPSRKYIPEADGREKKFRNFQLNLTLL